MAKQSNDAVGLGRNRWVIAEGYLPSWSNGPEPQLESHETCCLLNTGSSAVRVEITLYFEDRDPVGPYVLTLDAKRTKHLRFNDLANPQPVPKDTPYASVIEADGQIVVQHSRLDSRQPENALMTTIAWPAD